MSLVRYTSTYTVTGEDDATNSMNVFHVREAVFEVEVDPFDKPVESMTPEEKFEYWGEIFRELREQIRYMARTVMGLLSSIPVTPYIKVEYYRRLCTPRVPTQHFKTHNHPVRFVREGL